MAIKHYDIRIYGKVQGVFFRASARHRAALLDISGFTNNDQDGSVYIEAEGTEENLSTFIGWCHEGPERAEVTKVEVKEGPLKNFTEFEVKRGMF
ncbi:MAG TPA: acylphosphatase [Chitinophagales bacterium]|nr:acylphosphatase [Chitinophagales bacterium]